MLLKAILIASLVIVILTIGTGVYYLGKDEKRVRRALRVNLATFIPAIVAALIVLLPDVAYAATEGELASADGMGYLAAALSTGLATIGAGYAVGAVGASALGAVSEDPKILGKTLIFVGLAEGIAIYGLIVSILILGRL